MGYPVIHFEIMGTDAAKLQEFYRELFEWDIDSNNPMNYGLVKAEEGGIGGGVGSTPQGNRIVTVYVGADDPQAALDKAVQLGGQVVMPVTEIPDMVTFALFADPEGNVVGIVKN